MAGGRTFWVAVAAALCLWLGVGGLVSSLVAGDARLIVLFAALTVLGIIAESYTYFSHTSL